MEDNTNIAQSEDNVEDDAALVVEQSEEESEAQAAEVVDDKQEASQDDASQDDAESEDSSGTNEDEADDEEEALVPLHKLKKVRNEAKNLRDRLRATEARVKELEAGGNDEAISKLANELRMERLTNIIATKDSGAIEPAAVVKLIDTTAIKWEDNKPSNIDEVLENTIKSYPKLFSNTKGKGNVGERSTTRVRHDGKSSNQLLTDAYNQD